MSPTGVHLSGSIDGEGLEEIEELGLIEAEVEELGEREEVEKWRKSVTEVKEKLKREIPEERLPVVKYAHIVRCTPSNAKHTC